MCMHLKIKERILPRSLGRNFLADLLKTPLLKYQKWCIMLKGMNIELYRLHIGKSI